MPTIKDIYILDGQLNVSWKVRPSRLSVIMEMLIAITEKDVGCTWGVCPTAWGLQMSKLPFPCSPVSVNFVPCAVRATIPITVPEEVLLGRSILGCLPPSPGLSPKPGVSPRSLAPLTWAWGLSSTSLGFLTWAWGLLPEPGASLTWAWGVPPEPGSLTWAWGLPPEPGASLTWAHIYGAPNPLPVTLEVWLLFH